MWQVNLKNKILILLIWSKKFSLLGKRSCGQDPYFTHCSLCLKYNTLRIVGSSVAFFFLPLERYHEHI